jgi:TIR domain
MAYQYDVFISYKRKTQEWVQDIFLEVFHYYLEEAIGGRQVSIFLDRDAIESGDAWPQRLRKALACSRCMVPILLPSYFHSEWCVREFAVMEQRSRHYDLWTDKNPGGLIVPICISDGEHFPETARNIQALSCHEYHRLGKGFKNLDAYKTFQDVIIKWVEHVAAAIDRAPEWNEAWLSDNWLDPPLEHLLINASNIKAPLPKI